jgi:DNA-binding IclR family transcriptional regulator
MTEIRDTIDETVQMAVLDGRHNVYVAKVSGNQLLGLASEVGRRLPAHATGLGKVLLAGLPGPKLSVLLDGVELERYTDRTLTNRRALAQALAEIRANGFGEDAEEFTVGVRCVAVPVFDQRGTTVAALSVSVPIIRFDEAHRKRALTLLRDGAEHLSASLGFRPSTTA